MLSHHVLSVTLIPRTDGSEDILGAIHAGDECSQYKLRTEAEQSTAGDETTETVNVHAPCEYQENMQARHKDLGRAGMINMQFIWYGLTRVKVGLGQVNSFS